MAVGPGLSWSMYKRYYLYHVSTERRRDQGKQQWDNRGDKPPFFLLLGIPQEYSIGSDNALLSVVRVIVFPWAGVGSHQSTQSPRFFVPTSGRTPMDNCRIHPMLHFLPLDWRIPMRNRGLASR